MADLDHQRPGRGANDPAPDVTVGPQRQASHCANDTCKCEALTWLVPDKTRPCSPTQRRYPAAAGSQPTAASRPIDAPAPTAGGDRSQVTDPRLTQEVRPSGSLGEQAVGDHLAGRRRGMGWPRLGKLTQRHAAVALERRAVHDRQRPGLEIG
jgi:hypothetical protein